MENGEKMENGEWRMNGMHLAAHLLLERREVLLVLLIPERQRHRARLAIGRGIILVQLLFAAVS
jgi:hypothetical protein